MALTAEQKELKTKILNVLSRKDQVGMHAIGRALIHLLNRQTSEEQIVLETRCWNSRGFNSHDAYLGTQLAKFYEKNGYLSDKQMEVWQRPCKKGSAVSAIGKYWGQLLEEAESKKERIEG